MANETKCNKRDFAIFQKVTDFKLKCSFSGVTGFVIIVALALLVSGVFVVFFFTALVNLIIDKVSTRELLYFLISLNQAFNSKNNALLIMPSGCNSSFHKILCLRHKLIKQIQMLIFAL